MDDPVEFSKILAQSVRALGEQRKQCAVSIPAAFREAWSDSSGGRLSEPRTIMRLRPRASVPVEAENAASPVCDSGHAAMSWSRPHAAAWSAAAPDRPSLTAIPCASSATAKLWSALVPSADAACPRQVTGNPGKSLNAGDRMPRNVIRRSRMKAGDPAIRDATFQNRPASACPHAAASRCMSVSACLSPDFVPGYRIQAIMQALPPGSRNRAAQIQKIIGCCKEIAGRPGGGNARRDAMRDASGTAGTWRGSRWPAAPTAADVTRACQAAAARPPRQDSGPRPGGRAASAAARRACTQAFPRGALRRARGRGEPGLHESHGPVEIRRSAWDLRPLRGCGDDRAAGDGIVGRDVCLGRGSPRRWASCHPASAGADGARACVALMGQAFRTV